jgi:hypothetical protein
LKLDETVGTHALSAAQPAPGCVREHVSPWVSVTAGGVAVTDAPHFPGDVARLKGRPRK